MNDFEDDEEILLLPKAWQVPYKGPARKEHLSLANYLLSELLDRMQPFIPHLAEPIPYGARWHYQRYWGRDAYERGVLLTDRWQPLPDLDGYRIYLRAEGYALVFRELVPWGRSMGVKKGEWRSVLRHLPLCEASAALGSTPGILDVFARLSPLVSGCTTLPKMGPRAGRLAYWLRYLPSEIKKLKLA